MKVVRGHIGRSGLKKRTSELMKQKIALSDKIRDRKSRLMQCENQIASLRQRQANVEVAVRQAANNVERMKESQLGNSVMMVKGAMVYGIKAQCFKRIVLAIVTIQFQQLIVGIRFPRMMTDKEQIVLFRCHKSLLLLNIPTICECVCQPVQVVTDFHVRISRDFVFVITLIKVKRRKTGTILIIAFSEGWVLDIRWKSENERFLLLFFFLNFGRIRCFRVGWTNLWSFWILLFLHLYWQ